MTGEVRRRIFELRAGGMSYKRIAAEVKVSSTAVRYTLFPEQYRRMLENNAEIMRKRRAEGKPESPTANERRRENWRRHVLHDPGFLERHAEKQRRLKAKRDGGR